MKIYKFISGVIALISFLFFSYFFSGSGDGFSLSKLNPVEALEGIGIAFTFAFGFGVPIWLSYIFSILIFLGIPALIYYLILSLLKRLTRH
ncbi:hypothetical protein [Acinetobacter harbinensis]|uniref:hypothetical protein n=1 Tax=Acinetobacter harbinensis TaxID=1353941 RepID=UPI001C4EC847|nr:hypothetical protein [Acinetobacter harbinensis]